MLAAVSGLAFLLSTLLKLDSSLGYFLPLPIAIAACRSGPGAAWNTTMATAFLLLGGRAAGRAGRRGGAAARAPSGEGRERARRGRQMWPGALGLAHRRLDATHTPSPAVPPLPAVLLGPLRAVTYVLMHGMTAAALGTMWVWRWPWAVSVLVGSVSRMAGQMGYLLLSSFTMNENLFAVMVANVHNLMVRCSVKKGMGEARRAGLASRVGARGWRGRVERGAGEQEHARGAALPGAARPGAP